ncbi:MAG: amidohydrolase [Caulobacteraceae bacterium]
MKIYKNCIILTMDETLPYADYMIVEGGRIAEVGLGLPELEYSGADVVDLHGNTVIPGFWESHLHMVDGMRSRMELNLRDCAGLEDLKARLSKYCGTLSEGEWIVGHGWDESKLFGGIFPDRELLDKMCSSFPMILIRMDGHSLCANSKAIDALQLKTLECSPQVPYGRSGKPSGMFYEDTATDILNRVVSSFTESYIEKAVLNAQEHFLRNGITSVNDMCIGYENYFGIYRRLQSEERLKIRITASPYGLDDSLVKEFGKRERLCSERLKAGPPKYFMDGSFGSRTAFLSEDYADDPGNKGQKLLSDDMLREMIRKNSKAGKPFNIHAIGDQAVSCILDAISDVCGKSKDNPRNRIEHIQIVKPEDIERFKELSVTASFQPDFLYEVDLTLSRVGKDRLPNVYRFGSFLEAGVNVIFNSDWPYGGGEFPKKPDGTDYIGFEPLLGIHAACCRQMNEKEAVTPLQALKCYTVNAAYANYRENEIGKLKRGFLADFAVLSKDISRCEPDSILAAEVLMTVINGEIEYEKNESL